MKIEHKAFDSEIKAADDSTLTIEHWISTDEKDRGGDRMVPEGMIIKGRPVVLLAHGRGNMSSEPVAKPLDIRVESFRGKKGLVARTQFYPDAVGQRLYEKVRDGFMPNFSIGYGVIKSEDVYRDGKFDFRLVREWELLEYSLVSVPMCAGATTFKDAESLCFKVQPDDGGECPGDCKGDVKCAGHQEKADPPPAAETEKEDPPAPEGEKETTPAHPFQIVEDQPPAVPEGPTIKDLCDSIQIVADNVSRLSLDFIKATGRIDELSKAMEPLLKTLPPEPDGGEKGDEEHHDNPPEKKTPPRLVVVRDEVTPEAEKQAARARVLAIAREVISEEARKAIDRMKGRVP